MPAMNALASRLCKIVLACMVAIGAGSVTRALTLAPPRFNLDAWFTHDAVTLPASERETIINGLDHVRSVPWCPLRSVHVVAFWDPRKERSVAWEQLAQRRLTYVKALLLTYGVPEDVIGTSLQDGWRHWPEEPFDFVKIEMSGLTQSAPCPHRFTSGGFWVR